MRFLALVVCVPMLACTASRVSSNSMRQLGTVPTPCATVPSADSTIYDTTQVTTGPVPRSAPPLEYPAAARSDRLRGHVVVRAVVSQVGAVEPSSVTIAQSAHPLLDAEARRIVSLATFWPACRRGEAVRAQIAVPFDFSVSGNTAATAFGVIVGVWAGVMAAVLN